MKIGKAYCRELGRSIDIVEAGIHYFAQSQPRNKFTFYCSSPECDRLPIKVEILGANYTRVPIDSEGNKAPELADKGSENEQAILDPYFRTKPGYDHSEDCVWMIEKQAEIEFISEAESAQDKKRRKQRVAIGGLIEETSFLFQKEREEVTNVNLEQNDVELPDSNQSKNSRRRRIDQAKLRLSRPKTSPYFSELVSSYMKVVENQLYDEPLMVAGIGETTWGHFFFPVEWYSPENRVKHTFKGNVSITTLPYNFDWSEGMPNAVIMTFYDEVTINKTTARPSLMITRKQVDANPGSYVLIEAVKSALTDAKYKNYLRCYFYGRIDEESKQGNQDGQNNANKELVLKVKPLRLDTLELRRIDAENQEKLKINEDSVEMI